MTKGANKMTASSDTDFDMIITAASDAANQLDPAYVFEMSKLQSQSAAIAELVAAAQELTTPASTYFTRS